MTADAQLDGLVDEITRRVQARLAQGGLPAVDAARAAAKACAHRGKGECASCGGCATHKSDAVRALVGLGATRIGQAPGHDAPALDLAPLIDHTMLKADASRDDLKKLCDEAKRHGFATVCVNPANVRFCAAQLEGAATKAIAVVGFPLGASTPNAKGYEAREAVRQGAAEIDMVLNVGALKSRDYALVLEDMIAVVNASAPKPVKVILETGLLDHDQKVVACALAKIAGAAYVKTSTGFGPGGATVEDIALMREVVGPEMGVKASGGVRTTEDARRMVEAGATRIGASASVAIVTGGGGDGGKKKLKLVGGY
ncbi:MAG: deoxyribose-phosphate aldolase [Deltaproteobacteria bacterium]|nr:deoxyribose-phosphate aldolase [Deltaproteobacteria bacterium]